MSRNETDRRSAAETRNEALKVALRLFTEVGYDGASMSDIARELGISKPALYYHFRNKEDIILNLLRGRTQDLADFLVWLRGEAKTPGLLERAATRWVKSTTAEHVQVMRLCQSNGPLLQRMAGEGFDMLAGFEPVIRHFTGEKTGDPQVILVRMAFDTVRMTLTSNQNPRISHDDLIAAALFLSRAIARNLEV